MKLLFDENLSYRLTTILSDVYPGSVHVRDIGLVGSDDETIWAYAAEHSLFVMSKDADFYQRSILRGAPPKVIWLRVGNASTKAISELLSQRHELIKRFAQDDDATFLSLDPT